LHDAITEIEHLRDEEVRLTLDCPGDRLLAREVERLGSAQAVAQSIKGTEAIISKALVEHYKARAERAEAVVRQVIEAYDSGNLELNSPELDGDIESGIPPHPWHEQWLYHARQALATYTEGEG
jgi:hypothetical protein